MSTVAQPDHGALEPATHSKARLRLGIELRALRRRLGFSQRRLVQLLGLRAHSNLVDYERGRRIPPNDIVIACESILKVTPGHLERLRRQALIEEAAEQREAALRRLHDQSRSAA